MYCLTRVALYDNTFVCIQIAHWSCLRKENTNSDVMGVALEGERLLQRTASPEVF